jgi:ribosomal protein L20
MSLFFIVANQFATPTSSCQYGEFRQFWVTRIFESTHPSDTAYRKSLIHECVTGQRRLTEEDLRQAGGSQSVWAAGQTS